MHGRLIEAGIALGLTPRQAEVLAYWVRGYYAREIAQLLFRSFGTVRQHLNQARHRVGARTVRETAYLVMASLIPEPEKES